MTLNANAHLGQFKTFTDLSRTMYNINCLLRFFTFNALCPDLLTLFESVWCFNAFFKCTLIKCHLLSFMNDGDHYVYDHEQCTDIIGYDHVSSSIPLPSVPPICTEPITNCMHCHTVTTPITAHLPIAAQSSITALPIIPSYGHQCTLCWTERGAENDKL